MPWFWINHLQAGLMSSRLTMTVQLHKAPNLSKHTGPINFCLSEVCVVEKTKNHPGHMSKAGTTGPYCRYCYDLHVIKVAEAGVLAIKTNKGFRYFFAWHMDHIVLGRNPVYKHKTAITESCWMDVECWWSSRRMRFHAGGVRQKVSSSKWDYMLIFTAFLFYTVSLIKTLDIL